MSKYNYQKSPILDNPDFKNNDKNQNSLQLEKHNKTQSTMDIQSLVDMCSKKLDLDPNHKKALLLRASSYIKNKDFDKVKNFFLNCIKTKALEDVEMLLENHPKNSTAFYLMGCIHEKKGQIEIGIDFFNEAIEIDPNNVYALFSRGACYNMLGNYEKAIEDYSLALEKDSNRNGRKTILRNIGKVLGLNNDNTITDNHLDEKSTNEMNNSYYNLNNSKNIDNNIDNDLNNYINYQLRDIISSSSNLPNNLLIDKMTSLTREKSKVSSNSDLSNNYSFYNSTSNKNVRKSLNNFQGKGEHRLKNTDNSIFPSSKENWMNKSEKKQNNFPFMQNGYDLKNQEDNINNMMKNLNFGNLNSQNLDPEDIDNLIMSIKNNTINHDLNNMSNFNIKHNNVRSSRLENNKVNKENSQNSEYLQKNQEDSLYDKQNKNYFPIEDTYNKIKTDNLYNRTNCFIKDNCNFSNDSFRNINKFYNQTENNTTSKSNNLNYTEELSSDVIKKTSKIDEDNSNLAKNTNSYNSGNTRISSDKRDKSK